MVIKVIFLFGSLKFSGLVDRIKIYFSASPLREIIALTNRNYALNIENLII